MPELQNRRQASTRAVPVRPQLVPLGKPMNLEEQMAEAKQQYEKIVALWTLSSSSDDGVIPQNHQTRFVEALRELPLDVMNKVMAKEIRELQTGRAQIQLAQKTIRAREACIARIVKCNETM